MKLLRRRYEVIAYQQVAHQDDNGDLSNGRNEDGGLLLDLRSKVLFTPYVSL